MVRALSIALVALVALPLAACLDAGRGGQVTEPSAGGAAGPSEDARGDAHASGDTAPDPMGIEVAERCDAWCQRSVACLDAICPPDLFGEGGAGACYETCLEQPPSPSELEVMQEMACAELNGILCGQTPELGQVCACDSLQEDCGLAPFLGQVLRAGNPDCPLATCPLSYLRLLPDRTYRWARSVPEACQQGEWEATCPADEVPFITMRPCGTEDLDASVLYVTELGVTIGGLDYLPHPGEHLLDCAPDNECPGP